ncbi:RES domain-containing protein [Paenibacillus sp. 276b]|uniref:RES domain-containing protein n=1 Tax=Paenibacillus sp. 276b TaxID=1566277 RepID=UPI0008942809|nr:RES domain-containing protein [Paenibacillus sp. 276b]SEB27719.1 RES domain-containing protein [Paenibacillus sp. 276b]
MRKHIYIGFLKDQLEDEDTPLSELVETAKVLYEITLPRPPIKKYMDSLYLQGTPINTTVQEDLSDVRCIKFVLFWAEEVAPILGLLNGTGKLPFSRDVKENFEEFIETKLKGFMEELGEIGRGIIDIRDIKNIQSNCTDFQNAIEAYLNGSPEAAFMEFKKGMERIESLDIEPITKGWGSADKFFFKMRVGNSNQLFTPRKMFHIPFENRGWVKTNRYSIPGLPCLYLGSTPLTCWEEIGKPDLNTTHTSLFFPSENLRYYDISLAPSAMADLFQNNVTSFFGHQGFDIFLKQIRDYLIMWPLIACCSVKVLHTEDYFKPEYIISQLLLQWIQKSKKYDGVSYFSTKVNNYTHKNNPLYRNFAFPVKSNKKEGYCEGLEEKFRYISSAAPWQVFQLYKDKQVTLPGEWEIPIELMPGLPVRYNSSEFGRLETFLISTMDADVNKRE